jgi:sugar O-acyltransferase (sialic acid O-acetyltransferase NeuD family)
LIDVNQKLDEWNNVKKTLQKKEIIKFKQGEIYFMSVGQNVGYESFGKHEMFLRPVLVYKKLSKETFIGIPLTSKIKEGSYYFKFSYKGKISIAMLNQIRVFDIRRHAYFSGKIKNSDFKRLKIQLSEVLEITPEREFGQAQNELSKYNEIILKNDKKIKPQILILGAGGHCRSLIDVIEQEGKYKIVGIIENELEIGTKILDYEVIGKDGDLEKLRKKYQYAAIGVGQIKTPKIRIKLFNLLKSLGYNLPVIISPRAYVSKYAEIGEGTVIMHDALVNVNAKIGKNCIINTKALIEHDAIIEDNSHISTGAIINGGVAVKEGTFVGSNSVTKEYIEISGFIKAGSVSNGKI